MKRQAYLAKTRLFCYLRLILGFLIFDISLNNCTVLHAFAFDLIQAALPAYVGKEACLQVNLAKKA
jgi:hypothetical protein